MNFQTYLNELSALLPLFKNALVISTEHESTKEIIAQELNNVQFTLKAEKDIYENVADAEFIQMYNKYWINIDIGNIFLQNDYLAQINESVFIIGSASEKRLFLNIETRQVYAIYPGEDDVDVCSTNEEIFFDALLEYQRVMLGDMVFNVERKQFLHNVVKKAGGYDFLYFWEYVF